MRTVEPAAPWSLFNSVTIYIESAQHTVKGAEACAAALGELFKAWRWDVICIEDTFEAGKVEKQWDTYHAQHSAAVYSWNIHDKLNNKHAAFSATKLSSPNEFDFLRPHAVLAAASRCAFLMLAMLKSQTPSSKYSKSLSFHDSHCVVILTPPASAHGISWQNNARKWQSENRTTSMLNFEIQAIRVYT